MYLIKKIIIIPYQLVFHVGFNNNNNDDDNLLLARILESDLEPYVLGVCIFVSKRLVCCIRSYT